MCMVFKLVVLREVTKLVTRELWSIVRDKCIRNPMTNKLTLAAFNVFLTSGF